MDDLAALLARVERNLLGGERRYTRHDVAERAGVDLEESRVLWRALGFATVGDDDRVFTDADVEALLHARELEQIGGLDDDVLHAMTRIIGQTFARLASWQGQVVVDLIASAPELLEGEGDGAMELVDRITPVVSALHEYVWRRQLVAYFARMSVNAGSGEGVESAAGVGFVDMAGFTSFTRQSSEAELRGVLGAFETLATDVVSDRRGQIVKTIGDEVLYTADRPEDAAEIALAMIEAAEADERLPQLRGGVAYGTVVHRLGDVFGQTVNIASRLTSVARAGTVLVDQGMSERLGDLEGYRQSSLRPLSVRGYHHLRAWRLRRSGE